MLHTLPNYTVSEASQLYKFICLLIISPFYTMLSPMTIEQTVTIPADHQITLKVPREVPAGQARVIIQFPVRDEVHTAVPQEAKGQVNNEAFRQALRRAHGAWKNNPWGNHLDDVNAMRDEWERGINAELN